MANTENQNKAMQVRWGQSMQDVIKNQRIELYTDKDFKSQLSGLAVRALMTKGVFLGSDCSIMYSFVNDKLIECCISIDTQNINLAENNYEEIKNFLSSVYKPYKGTYFCEIKDRFIDHKMRTCVLLFQNKKIVIYIVDFKTFTAAMSDRSAQNREDLKKLVIQ